MKQQSPLEIDFQQRAETSSRRLEYVTDRPLNIILENHRLMNCHVDYGGVKVDLVMSAVRAFYSDRHNWRNNLQSPLLADG